MSHVLILTGMHRSATSLIASLLQRAGVALGAQLLEPNAQNPRGFFEDVDFFEFHENALHARGQNILVDRAFQFSPTVEEHARADALIAARAAQTVWGWKDPRTCLFLEFWREKIPHAQFLFVYRHPFDVLLSLMRRNERNMLGLLQGIEAWYAYNFALAEFHARYPLQTLLCNSYAVVDNLTTFNALMQKRFAISLQFDTLSRDAPYEPNELRRAEWTHAADTLFQTIHPDAHALYARLDGNADMPAPTSPPPATLPALDALTHYAAQLQAPTIAARRGLLFALLGITQAETLDAYITSQACALERWQQTSREHAAQRDAWQHTAQERAEIIHTQTAWAHARMADLEKLEAHPLVRALKKLGRV